MLSLISHHSSGVCSTHVGCLSSCCSGRALFGSFPDSTLDTPSTSLPQYWLSTPWDCCVFSMCTAWRAQTFPVMAHSLSSNLILRTGAFNLVWRSVQPKPSIFLIKCYLPPPPPPTHPSWCHLLPHPPSTHCLLLSWLMGGAGLAI